MARKTKVVTVPLDTKDTPEDKLNRDAGRAYFLKEMPASQAERWAFRVVQALIRSGAEVSDHVAGSGMAGLAQIGLRAFANMAYHEAVELMEEMFQCITIIRDKSHPEMTFPIMEEDIEEVSTRFLLRTEVFELHTGFSLAGVRQSLSKTPAINPKG